MPLDEMRPARLVAALHDIRFDGLTDLLLRARGATVFDVGCAYGHVAAEFAANGAALVHGCDVSAEGIATARNWFAQFPQVESRFEVVDLCGGPAAVADVFGLKQYDVVLFLAVHHKLRHTMTLDAISELIVHLGRRALTYFAWQGFEEDLAQVDRALTAFDRVHTSSLFLPERPAAIWKLRR